MVVVVVVDIVAEMEVEVEAVDESRFSFEEPYTFLYAFFLITIPVLPL